MATSKKPVVKAVSKSRLAAMSKAEQRVLIARDVLARLASGRITTNCGIGGYLYAPRKSSDKPDAQASYIFEKRQCQVCAMGAVFVAAVCRFDKIKIGDLSSQFYFPVEWTVDFCIDRSRIVKYLRRFFTKTQIDLIEVAYEGFTNGTSYHRNLSEREKTYFKNAEKYGKSSEDRKERLRRIAQNIIDNRGTFKPEALHDRRL